MGYWSSAISYLGEFDEEANSEQPRADSHFSHRARYNFMTDPDSH